MNYYLYLSVSLSCYVIVTVDNNIIMMIGSFMNIIIICLCTLRINVLNKSRRIFHIFTE